MIKTECGISKNQSLIKPVVNHDIQETYKIFLDISHVIIANEPAERRRAKTLGWRGGRE